MRQLYTHDFDRSLVLKYFHVGYLVYEEHEYLVHTVLYTVYIYQVPGIFFVRSIRFAFFLGIFLCEPFATYEKWQRGIRV